jgi:DNA helicase HerA-like ATPase
LTRHILITGTSGSGKTRVGQLVTEAASPNVPVIILDPMGEFTGLIAENPNIGENRNSSYQKAAHSRPQSTRWTMLA